MNKVCFLIGLILLSSCVDKNVKSGTEEHSKYGEIEEVFFEVDSLLKIDNGKFWNKRLYGPILLVNPETREFFANENDVTNKFRETNSLFMDTLPQNINIANTALNWRGKRWSMVMLPLPKDKISRNNLVIHELFHRIQPEIGFENLQEQNNGHLDTYNSRLLLKFELEALKRALSSNIENKKELHLKNALIFRNIRQNDDQKKNAENSLEISEGLAEFTAIMLSGRNEKEIKLHLINSINQFYTNPTFVRSFAYQTIPVYGYLFWTQKSDWHREISNAKNLTDYFIKSFEIDLTNNSSFEQIAQENMYNYNEILNIEKIRENERLSKILKFKAKFLEQPTLKLNFENMNISFDPRNIVPLENFGTVYPTLRVTDNWGILTVNNGALLTSNWSSVIVTAPIESNDEITKGDGWTLELNNGWKIEKNIDNFKLIKE